MNYTIEGAPLPVVICNLEGGETMLTEKGAMSWMSPNMKMETTTGGGIGKMFGRAFSGESMFINRYTAQGGTGLIAFASSFPGDIRAFEMKLTKILTRDCTEDVENMYRRMCFNVFAHNRDDHSKNFTYIYNEKDDMWRLSPAYDLTYSNTYYSEHTTTVDGNGKNPSVCK